MRPWCPPIPIAFAEHLSPPDGEYAAAEKDCVHNHADIPNLALLQGIELAIQGHNLVTVDLQLCYSCVTVV